MPKSNNYNLRIRIPKESGNRALKRIENGSRFCRKNEIKPVIAVVKVFRKFHHKEELKSIEVLKSILEDLNIKEEDTNKYGFAQNCT
tara:strand:+ start:671 stop:931 length:261 start_codon:yes stop_codon:yes gene_type:complete